MALYNDRAFAYERMQQLDPFLDNATDEQIAQFVAADERNHIAFLELSFFEKNKTFLFIHEIFKHDSFKNELEQLRRTNPAEFSRQLVNTQKSIERYSSFLNQKKYKTEKEKADWLELVENYKLKLSTMQLLISK